MTEAATRGDPTTHERARWLRNVRGFSVIPLDHPAAPVATDPKQVGKVPVEKWEPYQHQLADEDTLERWFGNSRPRNIGIITGHVSGVVVVDSDDAEAVAWAQAHLPPTPIRTRTAKGEHWFYRHPGVPVPNRARVQTEDGRLKLDVRGDGGYVVSPGAQHASGVRYQVLGDWKTPLEQIPVFDLAWITPSAKASASPLPAPGTTRPGADAGTRARAYLDRMGPAIEGQGGDQHTFRAACVLVNDFALDDATALDVLREWNLTCVPPWPEAGLEIKIRSAHKSGTHAIGAKLDTPREAVGLDSPRAATPRAFALTDSGNAEYFAARYGDDLRYDHRRARWLVWRGHRWQPDADAAVRRMAKAAMRHRLQDATALEDSEAQSRLAKWALASEARGRLEALLYLAQAEGPIADTGEEWDAHPWLLGVPNGVVNLRTGILRDGRRNDRLTMQTAVAYHPAAPCPRWTRFVEEVFAQDTALVDYVHRAVGYSLTGIATEQVFFVDWGVGANGKGTFQNGLADALGEYAYTMPFATVELNQRSAIPNDLAALVGRRFVIASETNDGSRLNEARLKALTGCDPITARFLHSEFFTFRPVAKFWLSVNHKPVVRDDSYGFWRRVRLIPFTQTFAVNARLADELRAEAPGILAWAVRGCLAWQREGLIPPAAVLDATATYEADSDPLSDFLEEATERDPAAEVSASDLYAHYKRWAERHGYADRERLTANGFGRKMSDRLRRSRTRAGWVYLGVARRESVTDSDQ